MDDSTIEGVLHELEQEHPPMPIKVLVKVSTLKAAAAAHETLKNRYRNAAETITALRAELDALKATQEAAQPAAEPEDKPLKYYAHRQPSPYGDGE